MSFFMIPVLVKRGIPSSVRDRLINPEWKPEERRELFDEAAGIVKFKRRKATALKKLEDEQQNLVRVNDILSEWNVR